MNKNYADNEALPHKKAGKNKMKSSPNKHGCPMNDFQPHNFANFEVFYFSQMEKKFIGGMNLPYCVDCGKRLRKKLNDEPLAKIIRDKDSVFHFVEFNKQMTRIISSEKVEIF